MNPAVIIKVGYMIMTWNSNSMNDFFRMQLFINVSVVP